MREASFQHAFYASCARDEIDLLPVIRRHLPSGIELDELTVEIGDRLEEHPYSETAMTKKMPDPYLCEGSDWLNYTTYDGRVGNVTIVPFEDKTGHDLPFHRNMYMYGVDIDGNKWFDKYIAGHIAGPLYQELVISIRLDNEIRGGTFRSLSKNKDEISFMRTKGPT